MTRVAKANQVPFTIGIFGKVFSRKDVMNDRSLNSLTISERDLVKVPISAKNILAQLLPPVHIQIMSRHKFLQIRRAPGSADALDSDV